MHRVRAASLVPACTLVLLLLSACTSTPPAPPLLTLARSDCAAIGDAAPVAANDWAKVPELNVGFGASGACLMEEGVARPYALVPLPAAAEGFAVSIGSTITGVVVLPLRVRVLDAARQVTRDVPPDDFMFRGTRFMTQIRGRAEDRYLLITTEPAWVGRSLQQIRMGVQTNTVVVGAAAFPVNTGVDSATNVTFAHNGTVHVRVQPLEEPGVR